MTSNEKLIKTRVGLFIFISLLLLAVMIVYFGRLGDGFRRYYRINATFSNASGLLKGADILMAGAKVGLVAEKPKIIENADGVGVEVPLQIYDGIAVPSKAALVIRRSGLLGDRFVDIIIADEKVWKSVAVPANTTVAGTREAGLDDLTLEAQGLLSMVREKMNELDETVLSKKTLQQASSTIANLNATSEKFAKASKRIDNVLANAETSAQEFKSTMTDARVLIKDAKNGRGTLGMLLTDRTMAENLRVFVLNLRQHGILWYKNTDGRNR